MRILDQYELRSSSRLSDILDSSWREYLSHMSRFLKGILGSNVVALIRLPDSEVKVVDIGL